MSWSNLARKLAGSILRACTIPVNRPGAITNFIIAAAEMIERAKVANTAIPPPRGTCLLAKRSAAGFEVKPALSALLLTRQVNIADSAAEPMRRPTAISLIFSILTAPPNGP